MVRFFLRLLGVLDDVARLEKNPVERLTPFGSPPQKKLEVHSEVLELLVLSVAHDRPRVLVLFDRQTLLVPANRFRLLDQRRDHTRKSPRLWREFIRRLVVLIKTHSILLQKPSLQIRGASDSSSAETQSLRGCGEFRKSSRLFAPVPDQSRRARKCRTSVNPGTSRTNPWAGLLP